MKVISLILFLYSTNFLYSQDIPRFIYNLDTLIVNSDTLVHGEAWIQDISQEIEQRNKIDKLNSIDSLRSSQNAKFERLFREYDNYTEEQRKLIERQQKYQIELFEKFEEGKNRERWYMGGVAVGIGIILIK